MRHDLRAAYSMIREYKDGSIQPGSPMTTDQQRLLQLLAEDLQIKFDPNDVGQVVRLAAEADTYWNQQVMTATVQFYDFSEAGNDTGAAALTKDFITRCPSAWYCGVVASL